MTGPTMYAGNSGLAPLVRSVINISDDNRVSTVRGTPTNGPQLIAPPEPSSFEPAGVRETQRPCVFEGYAINCQRWPDHSPSLTTSGALVGVGASFRRNHQSLAAPRAASGTSAAATRASARTRRRLVSRRGTRP